MTTTSTSGQPVGDIREKGLASGRIGTFTGAILGVSTVAPGYTLTASIGLMVAAVAVKVPAILIAGFIPMFLTAYAYRELNNRMPDCGASFTWSTKAFGPYIGWMCGWGMVLATIFVLSNLAAIAVEFFYLFLADLFNSPAIEAFGTGKLVNIVSTLIFLSVATWVSARGISTSERLQIVLVAFQMVVLIGFAITAIVRSGGHPGHLSFDIDWFNPFTGLAISALIVGVVGSIFGFWGWDTTLTLGEESKDPTKVPGRAGLLCVLSILITYLLIAVGVIMFAGVGTEGIGLGNSANSGNVFAALAHPVMGGFFGPFVLLAVFASAAASLQTTFLPAARTLLAMGSYEAFPKRFASINPRTLSPVFATVVAGVITGAFYTAVSLLSDSVLWDTVASLGIMICWYYGITALACVWYFRSELFTNVKNAVFKLLFPLLGAIMLLGVFLKSVQQSMDPANGSGSELFGIGIVFWIGFGSLVLGAILMVVMRFTNPAFFIGRTLTKGTSVTDPEFEGLQ